jgi:tRNA-Thr(GGU) m(6)t(6)A37 methyltransferase TsaA
LSDLRLKPIAVVRNGIRKTPKDWDKVQSRLILEKRYSEGLFKLRHFKHIWVIFGFHTRHDPEIPLVGVFASRSPTRPNKLGLTLVKLVSVKGGIVTVKGLDAFDGSPVFDIKPYEEEIDY